MSFKSVLRSARPSVIKAAVIGAAITGTLLGATLPAHASSEFPKLKVAYQDLDLTRDQDVERLYSRLRSAARSVCSSWDGRTLFERMQHRQCFDSALTEAVSDVNVTQLTKLHGASETQRIAQRR